MFLPTYSMSVQPTEEDAKRCYSFANKEQTTTLYPSSQYFEDDVQRHYENFRINRVSFGFALMAFCASFNSLSGLYVAFYKYEDILLMRMAMIARNIVVCVAWYTSYKIFYAREHPANGEQFKKYVSTVTNLSNFLIISYALVNGIVCVWKSSLGSCLDENGDMRHTDYFQLDCNPAYEVRGTPSDIFILLFIGNIFMVATLRCHSFWAVWISYAVVAVSVYTGAALSLSALTSIPQIFFVTFSIILYNGMEHNSLTMFTALLELEATNRVKTAEMKHFIGNVAHDLQVCRMNISLLLSAT